MKSAWLKVALLVVGVLGCGVAGMAASHPEWRRSETPFRIAGNLYYVGSEDLAAYLVATPEGLILINGNLASSPMQIRASVEKLGFRLEDVRILLTSHAHYDHCAGLAELKRLTHAQVMVMDGDVATIESGGRKDFNYGQDATMYFPPVKVDRVLHEGEIVALGGTVLTAHKTAGHTPGTTTWTMDEPMSGRVMHVVIVGSPNVNPGYRLVGNAEYPAIAGDYAQGFRVLKGLKCDVFLGAHGAYFDLTGKLKRMRAGDGNAFVDPEGYRAYVAEREQAFARELARQQAGEK
jgi:metallo-beta-lactamase class B